jgi:hypothetical protein
VKIYNVQQREICGSMQKLGKIVETYGSKNDRMHPFERWPKTEFEGPDGPPTVGRIGHRGTAEFVMTHYENGDRIRFTWKFIKPAEFAGYHHGEADDIGKGRLVFRSIIDMNTRGLKAALLWWLVMRPLHTAVVQDTFDKVERELGYSREPRTWSPWVRFLRWARGRNSPEYQRLRRELEEGQPDVA